MAEAPLTQARLKELLHYGPETGVFTWRVNRRGGMKAGNRAGSPGGIGYRYVTVAGRSYPEHRLAFFYMTGEFPPEDTDHINGKRSDNRWSNLRAATRSQNLGNMDVGPRNTSGYKGVSLMRRDGLWRATIRMRGKVKNLGHFDTPEEAHAAYCHAAERVHGEFASHRREAA